MSVVLDVAFVQEIGDVLFGQLRSPLHPLESFRPNVRARRGQERSTREFATHQPSAAMMAAWLPHRLQPWTSCAG